MADVTHYDIGDTYERTATFKVNGVLTDPAAVTARVRAPSGVITDYAYPSVNLLKDAVGVYRLKAVALEAGRYYYRLVGTDPAAGVEEDYFVVDPSMFDLLLELDTYALTTIEDAELYLDRAGVQGTKGSEADELRFLAGLINAKSFAIRLYTRRQFKPIENAATKKYRYDGSGRLLLAPSELRTLTSIKLYTDQAESYWWTLLAQTTASEADYLLEPRHRTIVGTYLSVALPVLPSVSRGFEVTVVGDWGSGIVPADVKQICEAEVAAEWERSAGGRQVDPETGQVVGLNPFDLSRNSQAALDRHRVARPRTASLQVR